MGVEHGGYLSFYQALQSSQRRLPTIRSYLCGPGVPQFSHRLILTRGVIPNFVCLLRLPHGFPPLTMLSVGKGGWGAWKRREPSFTALWGSVTLGSHCPPYTPVKDDRLRGRSGCLSIALRHSQGTTSTCTTVHPEGVCAHSSSNVAAKICRVWSCR